MAETDFSGRLAFDPDTGFHHAMVDGIANVPVQLEDGTWGNEERKALVPGGRVVTEDGGKTWRHATEDDTSHHDRYHERFAVVDSTANKFAELSLEHGLQKAEQLMRKEHPHHFAVQPDDPHFEEVRSIPNAATITSHTEAYR